tara:strand:+ start:2092 stop:2709 length:618 start_codon:yes stop_codon:yes gene_type:complete
MYLNTRLILGVSSLWIFIPYIYYHIYFKKYIFIKNLIISSAIVSIKYWSIFKKDNIYLNIDRIFARILFIYILIKSIVISYNDNYKILQFILLSCVSYLFSRYHDYKNKWLFKTIDHSLFRYFGYLSLMFLLEHEYNNIYNTQIKLFNPIINALMYILSTIPLFSLNKYLNEYNYIKYYILSLIYVLYVIILFIIITDMDMILDI